MNHRDTRKTKCLCDGYSYPYFPHRRGSKFCHFRANGEQRQPGDPDFADQYFEWVKEHDPGQLAEPAEVVELEEFDDIPF